MISSPVHVTKVLLAVGLYAICVAAPVGALDGRPSVTWERTVSNPGPVPVRHSLPLVMSASDSTLQGFVRVINHSNEAGTVRVEAIDDDGVRFGPVTLGIAARQAVQFNSRDLEEGNVAVGLSGGVGDGAGHWRLELTTSLDIEPSAYIRTSDGFLTSMHDRVVESGPKRYHVPFFNPGSNRSKVSELRIINTARARATVEIDGWDAGGQPAEGTVRLTLEPLAARTITAQALESGSDGLAGGLGDGAGKWQLFISADTSIEVMNLLRSRTGHLVNLSAPGLRDLGQGRRRLALPLFLPASDRARQGIVRLLNHSGEEGTVRIYGIDDDGVWFGPVTLSLEAGSAAQFNSADLEEGNPAKGLSGELGAGVGSWRLLIYSEFDVEALAYVRTADGFMTTMYERVRESAMRHHVAFFNPGSNRSNVSRLRLINPGEDEVGIVVAGRDADGKPAPGGEVSLRLGAGEAREVTAQALESGGDGLVGSLGDGMGKWQLFVSADAAIEVVNLLRSRTGHLTNLSTSSQTGVVSERGIDAPVALDVEVDIPPETTSLRAGDLTRTVLGSGSGGVVPGETPSLLVASDAEGAVMYALVNEDGGLLGEAPGTVRVSVASTAVVLVALAAGYRIPSVTPVAVAAILSHPEFGALIRALVRLMGADKNYLLRLSDYPDVVTVIQRMAGSLPGAGAAVLAKSNRPASGARSALPDGIVKENFYCTPFTRRPCSPWDEHEPWRWFGSARGAEVYFPDGTSWARFLLGAASGRVLTESYADFLVEATQPPFLARSEAEGARAVHAAANPSFVRYAMELHEGSQFRDWYYVPGNATTLAKLRNSGAAYREVRAGEGRILGPHIDRIRFERYRLTGRADGEGVLPERAAMISFLNTFRLLSSIANVVTDVSVVEAWLDTLSRDPRLYPEITGCANAFTELYFEHNDPNRTVDERAVAYFGDAARGLFGMLLIDDACRALVVRAGGERLERELRRLIVRASLDAILSALSVVKPFFDAANDTVPNAVSYFDSRAARSEYYIEWDETPDGQTYISRVSRRPLPVAAFTYAQQRGFRLELDASQSEGEGLRYEWQAAGRRIGTGRVLTYDFRAVDTFDVTLTVRDRSGVTAVERASVSVTAGRAPEVRTLTCTPTGRGTAFTMQTELSDADNDIATVEWFSSLSNTRPDRVTGVGQTGVTLNAPGDASHTRAKVRVVDARGNVAQRNCPVEFELAPPVPRISDVSAEEGEALEFTVTLDRVPAEAMTFHYATYRATARSSDYTGHFATSLRFGPGERSKTITVQTTEDTRVEDDETFYVYLTDAKSKHPAPDRGLPIDYLARASGTIRDDDETGQAAPVPRIADAGAEEGEALEFTVRLDRAPAKALSYYYATYRGTAGSGDYTGHLATSLRFSPGERSKTIAVQTTEDTEVEDDETFYVYVTASESDLSSSRPTRYLVRALGTIRDDDEGTVTACTGSTVHIPDAALRRLIEEALDKRPGAPITPADMRSLRSLRSYPAENQEIERLTGLQCATGLIELTLWDSRISDLSPLAGLTALEGLYLHDNRISDVSPLAELTALKELGLVGNQISDASPLAGLTTLEGLQLNDNQVSDVSPLARLTALERLRLSLNQISDVSPLAGLTTLEGLYLNDNQISDVSPLAGLTALKQLTLAENNISNIGPLVANPGLGRGDDVVLLGNPLSDEARDIHIPALLARGVSVAY